MNESRNPKSDGWKIMPKLLCFKDVERPIFCFFVFGFVLLFCKLLCLMSFLWSGFGEPVLVMEQNPCCSIENIYKECKSRFLEMIGVELSKEWKDVDKEKLYEVG